MTQAFCFIKRQVKKLNYGLKNCHIEKTKMRVREKRAAEDGEKAITDPHFHGGRTAPGSTETPALTQS